MRTRLSSAANAKPPSSARTVAKRPLGFSYSREQDERPARLKALHNEHPHADCAELARLYEAAHGVSLSDSAMSIALLQAGVSLRREERQEQAERPSRIAAIFAQMKAPTRDKLGEAYQKQYGISLADEAIQEALRTARIKIIAPRRKPDLDEVAARPERLRELISQHPELNYDQLGRKYEERYGVRLSSSLVGLTLNRLGIHRIRVVDSNELSERPGRLRALAERYPDLEYAEVAQEYERLYQTSLHPATVQRTLNQLGLHRIRRTDDSEVAARPDRVRKLAKSHPRLSYAELARLYEQSYHVPVCSTGIQAALRTRHGVYRQRPADPEEKKLRQLRLLKLRLAFPELSDTELAASYSKRYGVRLSPSLVTAALNEAGLYRNRKPDPDEVKQRAERLKRLHESHPKWTGRRLVEEYKKKYGVELDILMVTHALTSLGIYRGPGMSRAAIRQREGRLKAIAQEHPDLSKAEIIRKYNRRFGQSLRISAGRLILRRLGY